MSSTCPSPSRRPNTCLFLNVLGLLFATSEAEEDPAFLSNITVGLQVNDSCISRSQALVSTLALLSSQLQPNNTSTVAPSDHAWGRLAG